MLSRSFLAPLMALIVTLVVGMASEYGLRLEQERIRQEQRSRVVSVIGQYRAALEGELNATLYLTNGLVAYVVTHSVLDPAVARSMLKTLYDQGHHVRNIGLAPGNRLAHVYPLAGNEKALGLYYPDLPDQWPAVERAIRERQPHLAGPVALKQGGVGFIYRVPVFIGAQGDYWGMLSMVLDEASLFAKTGVAPEVAGLKLALRGKDGTGKDGEIFMGDASLFGADAVTASINTPGGSWQMAAQPLEGWTAGARIVWLRAGAWGIGLVLAFLLYSALTAIAKRLRAEAEVKLIVDTEPECVKVLAPDGTLVQMNRAGLDILEAESDDEVIGRNVAELVVPEYREAFVDLGRRVCAGESGTLEFEIVGLKGRHRWLYTHAAPMRDADGHITGLLGVTRDITEQKRTEQARRESEEKFRQAMVHAPIGMALVAPDGRWLEVNPALCRIVGYTPEALLATDVQTITHPDDLHADLALVQKLLDGEIETYELEKRYVHQDGHFVWAQLDVVLVRDQAGVPGYFIAQIQDISERRQIHEALKQSEERLREAQQIAQIGSWEVDLAAGTVICSDVVFGIFEIAPRAVTSWDAFLEAIHPDDRALVQLSFTESIKNKRPFDVVHRIKTTDGTLKYAHESGKTLYGSDGRGVRMIGTIQDVTLEKLNEEALRESEERFKTVADHTYDWEYWRGPSKEMLYLSPSCERITGYSQYEFISDPDLVQSIVHPDDRPLVDDHLQDYRDDMEHALDFRIVRKDGEVRWIAHGCRPVFGHDGSFMGRRVSNRDVTDRRLAERKLLDTKERLSLALDASSQSIWDYDIGTGTVYLDAQWAKIIGAPAGDTTTTPEALARQVEPQDAEAVAKAILKTFKGVTPNFQEEFRIKAATGDWVWIRCSGKVVERDGTGRAVRAIGTILDVTTRRIAEEKIRQLAHYDPLTNLPNRRLMEDRLHQLIVRAKREHQRLTLLFIDLDNFKPVNDELGHAVGDWLLQAVAQRMQGCLRESDTAARVGGDEFVVLLPDTSVPDDAVGVAEKIRQALQAPFVTPEKEILTISSSIGVTLYPDHADNERDLLRLGDEAMYRAKKAGRNTVALYATAAPDGNGQDLSSAEGKSVVHLTWKPGYACGEATIDSEHCKLFRLANHLLDQATSRDASPELLNAAFDALLSHVVEHFAHEESILRSHRYAHVEEHAVQHKALIERALRLRRQADESGVSVGELVDFIVAEVVVGHMLRVDRDFYGIFSGAT